MMCTLPVLNSNYVYKLNNNTSETVSMERRRSPSYGLFIVDHSSHVSIVSIAPGSQRGYGK